MTPRATPSRRSDLELAGSMIERGAQLTIDVDGTSLVAFEGETVAAALLASGRRIFRQTARTAAPRGVYCGIGICYDCLMVIDGKPNTRACSTYVRAGMRIDTQRGWVSSVEAGREPTAAGDDGSGT